MAKLLVALLLCGGANAMGIYGGETNGCGEPCAGVHESEGTKTQAGNLAFSVTFECYGEDVTATKVPFVPVLCDGS